MSNIPHLRYAIAERRILQAWPRHDFRQLSHASPSSIRTRRAPLPQTHLPPREWKPVTLPQESRKNGAWDQQRENTDEHRRYRNVLIGGTVFAFVAGLYITNVIASWRNEIKRYTASGKSLPQNADVSDRWRQLGRDYDDEVEWSEKYWFTDIKGKRSRLVSQAYGKVLEVSAGTGRNFEYYNLKPYDPTRPIRRNLIKSLTINDQSPVMIAAAEKKLELLQEKDNPFSGKVNFIVGDAGIRGTIERPEGGYDTIIQTMGLCSMVDPVGFLRTMGKLCRQPGEHSTTTSMQEDEDDGRGGRILLLEHGRSRYDMVNKMLDSGASLHADHYGCWWNKDIGQLIEQSGLEIEKVQRYHVGTTWEFHLRPKQIATRTSR